MWDSHACETYRILHYTDWGHDSKPLRSLFSYLSLLVPSPRSTRFKRIKSSTGELGNRGKLMAMEKKQQHQCYGAGPKPTFRFAKHWAVLLISIFPILNTGLALDYGDALKKSLLYFESQRSGRLPYNQRVTWRHHSGLTDGLEQGVSINLISLSRWVLHFSLLKIMKDAVCLILCRWIWSEDIMMQETMWNLDSQWPSPWQCFHGL